MDKFTITKEQYNKLYSHRITEIDGKRFLHLYIDKYSTFVDEELNYYLQTGFKDGVLFFSKKGLNRTYEKT